LRRKAPAIITTISNSFDSIMASGEKSGTSTPTSRFTTQAKTADDLLSAQTVGLVQLDDFRKRRAEAIDVKGREALDSGRATPCSATDSPYV
jgi:protein FAM50